MAGSRLASDGDAEKGKTKILMTGNISGLLPNEERKPEHAQ